LHDYGSTREIAGDNLPSFYDSWVQTIHYDKVTLENGLLRGTKLIEYQISDFNAILIIHVTVSILQ